MRASLILAAAGLVTAAPTLLKRDTYTDAQILNYALTLEHLEDTFYRTGLANYSHHDFEAAGFKPSVRKHIETIASDEKTHVAFLTTALTAAGAKPVAECTYAFGVKDVKGFVATASILEGVGVSAYLGAAASIMQKAYLTAAGSILTVEARHSSYIRDQLKENPFPQPFDDPLSFDEVYSLAAQFIVTCPSTNPPLPFKAFPVLSATCQDCEDAPITTDSTIVLKTQVPVNKDTVKAAFITVTGPIFVDVDECEDGLVVYVPKGVNGQSYVVLVSSDKAVTDDNTIAGPAILEICTEC